MLAAVAAGFLFRIESLSTEQALLSLGLVVNLIAPMALLVRFSAGKEAVGKNAMKQALQERSSTDTARLSPAPDNWCFKRYEFRGGYPSMATCR